MLHEFLWITGELSDSPQQALAAKLNNEREARNHLLSVSRTTVKHFQVIRRICNGVLDERRAWREQRKAQSVRDPGGAVRASPSSTVWTAFRSVSRGKS